MGFYWYGAWTLGELEDAYELMRGTSVCNGDINEITIRSEDE